MMTALDCVEVNKNFSKNKFSDFDTSGFSFLMKNKLYDSSASIISELKSYKEHLEYMGVLVTVLIDVDYSKLFFIDSIYFKYNIDGVKIEVLVDLKKSLNYRILEKQLNSGNMDINRKYLKLYEDFWSDAISSVVRRSEFDLSVLEG